MQTNKKQIVQRIPSFIDLPIKPSDPILVVDAFDDDFTGSGFDEDTRYMSFSDGPVYD